MLLLFKIFEFIFSVIFNLFCMLCILRVYMQIAQVTFVTPLGQGIIRLTNWAVLPLQHLLPRIKKFDLPSFAAAYFCSLIHIVLLALIGLLLKQFSHLNFDAFIFIFVWSILNLIKLTAYLLTAIILAAVILSWIRPSPQTPSLLHMQVQQLSAPLLRPIQKRIPSMGGLDFSPFIILMLMQLILISISYYMEYGTL